MKKILFVTWDGADTNYLEGLFLPIFQGLTDEFNVHIIQFTWASPEKRVSVKNLCTTAGVLYTSYTIIRKPHPLPGTMITVFKGITLLKKYIKEHHIDIVLPRSTFPALMVLNVLNKFPHLKFIFDADGLPLDERVDFSGLKPTGFQYKFLKSVEFKAIIRADAVLTRTHKAIKILTKDNTRPTSKFFVVTNGRNTDLFKPFPDYRLAVRSEIGLNINDILLVYAGSLGPQYCVDEMIYLYKELSKKNKNVYLLILTHNPTYIHSLNINDKHIIIRKVNFTEMPKWLSAADVGLAIRETRFSMQGVAPIKLGEYLLTGLPIIASSGIGDTEELLKNHPCCFILKDHSKETLSQSAGWITEILNKEQIREYARELGLKYFGLEKSIELYKKVLNSIN